MSLAWLPLDNGEGEILINPERVDRIEEGPPDEWCAVYVRGRKKPYQVAGTLLEIGRLLMTSKFNADGGGWYHRLYPDPRIPPRPRPPGSRPPTPKMVPACRLVPPLEPPSEPA